MNALVVAVTSGACTACLLPPEYKGIEERVNFLPEIDRTAQRPRDNVLAMPFDCPLFDVSTRVRDKNDEVINYRFVANADFEDAFLVFEGSVDPQIGSFAQVLRAIQIQRDFPVLFNRANPETPPSSDQVGLLSLYLTDSPEWLIPEEAAPETTIGLGDIPPAGTDGGVDPYGVTEVRWTFVIEAEFNSNKGECPL